MLLSAWVLWIKGYLESRLSLPDVCTAHDAAVTGALWICSSIPTPGLQPSEEILFNYVQYSQFKSPGIWDDQAEGCHVLSLSHSGKWIPLPRVISVSYNKKLIHNVTHSEMQNYSQGSLQGCAGAIRILPLGPWWVPQSPRYPGNSIINLPVNMHDLGLCLTLHNVKQNLNFFLPRCTRNGEESILVENQVNKCRKT